MSMVDVRDDMSAELSKEPKGTSLWRETISRLFQNKGAVIGMIFLCLIILMACFADLLYDYKTRVIEQNVSERLLWPSKAHPFGTDEYGRDVAARVVHGSRISLAVSFSAVAIAVVIGGTIGAIAGYYRTWVDNLLMRLTDVLLAIPMTMFAIVIVAALGPNTVNLILALAFSSVPVFARVVRAAVITVRDTEYIEAARAIGATDFTIITKHILPNCLGPVIVQVTLQTARAIYNTSALSFLGMGVQAPTPEWGGLLSSARTYIRDYSYLAVIPGLAIMLTILSLNLMGDGLRDALDPRLR